MIFAFPAALCAVVAVIRLKRRMCLMGRAPGCVHVGRVQHHTVHRSISIREITAVNPVLKIGGPPGVAAGRDVPPKDALPICHVCDNAPGLDVQIQDTLLYTESGHMPAWAAAAPMTYWDAADLHERANGRLFQRVEVALPTALTAAEQRELAVGFARHLTAGEQLPYTLAIHAGAGTNPHCHLLISERTNDGLERSAAQWFRRYNAAEPAQGGARKTTALRSKAWLVETRAAWAEQTNQALERAGHAIRVDHRSLAAQGIERLPSLHLGPTVAALEARGIETERRAEGRRREQVNAALRELTTAKEEVAYERTADADGLRARSGRPCARKCGACGKRSRPYPRPWEPSWQKG